MGLQADLAGNKAMTITRRQVLTWIPPVVAIVHLPVHAQTSPIATGPQTPLPPQCLWTRNEDGQVTAISRPFDDQCVDVGISINLLILTIPKDASVDIAEKLLF
jgi:hypothetical protein